MELKETRRGQAVPKVQRCLSWLGCRLGEDQTGQQATEEGLATPLGPLEWCFGARLRRGTVKCIAWESPAGSCEELVRRAWEMVLPLRALSRAGGAAGKGGHFYFLRAEGICDLVVVVGVSQRGPD